MAVDSAPGATHETRTRPPGSLWRRFRRGVSRWMLPVYAFLAVTFLALPVLVMIAFSFNDPAGRANLTWQGFSIDAWLNPLGPSGLGEAVFASLLIAFLSTIIATAIGVLMALALVRHSFRGRGATNLLVFLPMSTPEIVLGTSLLTLFIATAQGTILPKGFLYPLGMPTILIAHVMFNISFVVVTVKARIQGFDRNLEEAAMDLGANEWATFWKVTFPLIRPGIIAAALLAFSLSIDDFIVTNFTSGNLNTFPVWVWGTIRNNLPPQVHVIGSAIFLLAVSAVAISSILSARGQRPAAVPR